MITKALPLALITAFFVSTACGGAGDAAADVERLENAPTEVCEKMKGCMDEWMADVPESQREMVRNMMGGENCEAQYAQQMVPSSDTSNEEPDPAEIARAVRCLDRVMAASCSELREGGAANFEECAPAE